MNYKQNFKTKNKQLPSYLSFQSHLNNQKILLKLWQQYNIHQSYQHLVLTYLDTMTTQQDLSKELNRQIRYTHQKDNYYFHIEQLVKYRSLALENLYQEILILEQYKQFNNNPNHKQPHLQKVCDLLDSIRKYHLLISQEVYQMINFYKCNIHGNVYLGYYLDMFKMFDKDLTFLKDSLLQFYIPFSNGYDPLFLEPLRLIKEAVRDGKKVYDPYIGQLFNLNPSYLYRMLRAHQRMLGYISYVNDDPQNQIITFRNHKQNNAISIQQNEIPIKLIEYEKPQPQKQSIKPLNIKLIKNLHYTYKPPITSPLNNQSKIKQQTYDNSLNKQKQFKSKQQYKNLQLVPQFNFNYSKDCKKSKVFVDLQSTSGHINKKLKLNVNNISEDRQELMDDDQQGSTKRYNNKNNKHSYRRFSPIMAQFDDSCQVKQHKHQGNHIENSMKKSRKLPKLHIASRLESNISGNRSRLHTDKREDCLCRKKYKEKHPKSADHDINELQATQRRKNIIKNIKMKYKALAEKEMRYQVAKIGDKIYYQMKATRQKQIQSRAKSKPFY